MQRSFPISWNIPSTPFGGKEVTRTAEKRTANDQWSDALNPTSPEHGAAVDNRANQLNPNNPLARNNLAEARKQKGLKAGSPAR